jgi:hypothetical protein
MFLHKTSPTVHLILKYVKGVYLLLLFCRLLESNRPFVLKFVFDVLNSNYRDTNVRDSDVRDFEVRDSDVSESDVRDSIGCGCDLRDVIFNLVKRTRKLKRKDLTCIIS